VVPQHTRLSLFIALLSVVAQWAFAAEGAGDNVTATTLDGASLTGKLYAWTDHEVKLVNADGEQTIRAAELLSLQWSPHPPLATKTPRIELVDGTIFPIDDYVTQSNEARVTLHGDFLSDKKQLAVPVKTVAGVVLKEIEGKLAKQWDEIRGQEFVSDVLVIRKQENSLDYIEGVVGDVSAAKVKFTLDGQSIEVARGKVAGMSYYRGDGANNIAEKYPLCVLHGREGLRAKASRLELADGQLLLTTTGGLKLAWPLGDICLADFTAGKVVFLSDLEPISETWTSLVGLPKSLEMAGGYGRPRRDGSAFGGLLGVQFPGDQATSTTAREQTFTKGLALRSRTEIVFQLPRGFRQFHAIAGIEPQTSASGDVMLTLDGDGRRLLEIQVAGDQLPQDIELDIAGVKKLTIVVDYGKNLDTGDWLNLCNARIVK
jgi:hypothetical protein